MNSLRLPTLIRNIRINKEILNDIQQESIAYFHKYTKKVSTQSIALTTSITTVTTTLKHTNDFIHNTQEFMGLGYHRIENINKHIVEYTYT